MTVINLTDGSRIRSIEAVPRHDAFAWSPDSRSLVVLHASDSAEPGIFEVDLESGRSQRLADRSALVSDLQWTSSGPSYFTISPPQPGSWTWNGTKWVHLSDGAVVASAGDGSLLLEARAGMGIGGEVSILATAPEHKLTPAGAVDVGLALLSAHKALVWRDGSPGRFVLYDGSLTVEIASPRICARGEVQTMWFICGISAGEIELLAIDARQVFFLNPGFPTDAVASAVIRQK